MPDPDDARAWIDALFIDVLNGTFTLLAGLCLVYLFSVARNLADPGKRDRGHIVGAAIAVSIFAFSLMVIFFRDGGQQVREPVAPDNQSAPAPAVEEDSTVQKKTDGQTNEDEALLDALKEFNTRLENLGENRK